MATQDLPQMTDAELASAYQQDGDNRCLGELYFRYHENVLAYCIRFTHDRETALDIAQEVFLRAAERIHQLRNTRFFGGWLFRIVRNECINFLNAQTKKRTFAINGQPFSDENEEFMEWSAAEEKEQLLLALSKAMADVDEDSRALLVEKYEDGLPIVELQSRYGISESAMKMRLSRARKRVQDRIAHIIATERIMVA